MSTIEKRVAPKRKTLVQQQAETTVRDPTAHAKNQISELDKTAARSVAKRKACADEIAADKIELAHVEEQIANIRLRYDSLCKHLEATRGKRSLVIQTLESCITEERSIMMTTQSIVHTRRIDDSKLGKEIASGILKQARGFGVDQDSTFHQTRAQGREASGLPSIRDHKSKSSTR